jgi:REP element-mobilizing transposase RayT
MTAPRQIVAGRTYLISRRCTQRQFLLRPDKKVSQIYLYCLGEAVARFRITLHAFIAMGNHHHLVVRDNEGNLPAFLAHLHKLLAKALNCHRNRWENFWAAEQPNAVFLVDAAARFTKLIYVLANPVADDLVEHATDWPGAISYALSLSNREVSVKRPSEYFREDGPMPEEIVLRVERPDGFEQISEEDWAAKVRAHVEEAEAAARTARLGTGRRVLGRKGVLRVDVRDRPQTVEPRGALRPFIACVDRACRKLELALLRGFRAAYRRALIAWRGGARETCFPPGTYRMRWLGAAVEGSSTAVAA